MSVVEFAKKEEAGSWGRVGLPIWSVVSFDKCEASGLAYDAAAKLLADLDAEKIPGLTIVTDDAARRMRA